VRHVQSRRATRVHAGTRPPTRSTRDIAAGFPRAPRRSVRRWPADSQILVITITGQTAVVVGLHGYTVELINLKTRHVFPPIAVGAFPAAVAITA
jgi:hypothetical protein